MKDIKEVWSRLDEAYPEMLARLVLLGTVHQDPKGYRRLTRFLSSFQPDAMLVEISPYALAFRRRHQAPLQEALRHNLKVAAQRERKDFSLVLRHPEIAAIRRQLSIPFEYRAASAVSERNRGGVFLIDKSSFSWRLTKSWRELISVENLAVLIASPPPSRSIHHAYRRAYELIHGSQRREPVTTMDKLDRSEQLWAKREYFMARQIERILKLFQPQRPVYIGGWWHLTPSGRLPTIRSLLDVNDSRCRLLDEVEL